MKSNIFADCHGDFLLPDKLAVFTSLRKEADRRPQLTCKIFTKLAGKSDEGTVLRK
jgi:hypothetical protein